MVLTHLWCGLAVKNKGMEQLRARDRHQEPATEPPRTLVQPPLLIHNIIEKLHAPGGPVDCRSQAKLFLRRNRQCKARQTGPDGGSKARRQHARDARVALAEGLRIICAEVCAESNKEAVQKAMEQKQKGHGDGKTEDRGAMDRRANFLSA